MNEVARAANDIQHLSANVQMIRGDRDNESKLDEKVNTVACEKTSET